MISKLHDRLGTAGFVVAIVALVAALGGAAWAAGGLTKQQEKQVVKIAKKYAGKQGPQGPAGPAGSQGPTGPKGDAGAAGSAGASGKSVVTGTLNPGQGGCTEGGVSVEVEGSGTKKSVCNGTEGQQGPAGSPWTAGGTLPTNATETGAWAFGVTTASGEVQSPISFAIPLQSAIPAANVHFINTAGKEVVFNLGTFTFEELTPTQCLGSVAAPSAKSGNLCIYTGTQVSFIAASNLSIKNPATTSEGASVSGAMLNVEAEASGARGNGTWAVTG
jgi:hypothetical protein